MASKGYMVGPAAKDGYVTIVKGDCPAALVALSVYREKETNVNIIYDDVTAVLTDMNAYYYSLVISLSHEATCVGPNFQIPPKKNAHKPPLPPGAKKNMN